MSSVVPVGSDRCGLDDLFLAYGTEAERGCLGQGTGWSRRWTGTWRTSGGEVACAVRVTFGEPGFAPRPIEAVQPPGIREHWRRTWNFTWWSLRTSDNPGSIYSRLRAELDVLAAALATTIDPAGPADSTLGAPSLYVSRYPRRPRKPRTLTATTG